MNNAEKKSIKPPKRWNLIIRIAHKFLKFLYPFKIYGETRPFTDRNYLVVANHYSMWDIIYPLDVAWSKVHFIAKSDLKDNAIVKWAIEKTDSIFVTRDGTDVKPLMTAMRYLKNGDSIVIFPEGTRNKGNPDELLPFKGGACLLSLRTQTPIIPIVQLKKAKVFKRHAVFVGEPIEFTDYYGKKTTAEDIENCEKMLREKMIELRNYFKDNFFQITGKKLK